MDEIVPKLLSQNALNGSKCANLEAEDHNYPDLDSIFSRRIAEIESSYPFLSVRNLDKEDI